MESLWLWVGISALGDSSWALPTTAFVSGAFGFSWGLFAATGAFGPSRPIPTGALAAAGAFSYGALEATGALVSGYFFDKSLALFYRLSLAKSIFYLDYLFSFCAFTRLLRVSYVFF